LGSVRPSPRPVETRSKSGQSGRLVAGVTSEIASSGAAGRAYTRLLPGAGTVRGVQPTTPQALLEAAADRVALAAILDASGRHREAAATLRDALSVYERVLGRDHYEVAGVLENLAGVAERAAESEQAAALRARAQRIRRRVLGHTHRGSR
jgi:hypothetical protein